MTKTSKTKPKSNIVRVSPEAKTHLFRVVDERRAEGLSASGAAVLNELILSIPLKGDKEKPA